MSLELGDVRASYWSADIPYLQSMIVNLDLLTNKPSNPKLIKIIGEGVKHPNCFIRRAAIKACRNKTSNPVLRKYVMEGLKDPTCAVRAASMSVCMKEGISIDPVRDFEPPEHVYKSCVFGEDDNPIIVVASIPSDAHIKGVAGGKCRASKAIIESIIGGDKNTIVHSWYDRNITYHIGDEVVIDNFDIGDVECSTGFHFFCTMKEALKF